MRVRAHPAMQHVKRRQLAVFKRKELLDVAHIALGALVGRQVRRVRGECWLGEHARESSSVSFASLKLLWLSAGGNATLIDPEEMDFVPIEIGFRQTRKKKLGRAAARNSQRRTRLSSQRFLQRIRECTLRTASAASCALACTRMCGLSLLTQQLLCPCKCRVKCGIRARAPKALPSSTHTGSGRYSCNSVAVRWCCAASCNRHRYAQNRCALNRSAR